MKKLYKIYQDVNNAYDTYDSAIVCAKDEFDAKKIHPWGNLNTQEEDAKYSNWCMVKDVQVVEIGIANDALLLGDVICASFNAG